MLHIKSILISSLAIALLASCSNKPACQNRIRYVSGADSTPVFYMDISKHPDTLREEVKRLYKTDPCELCAKVDFKIPFVIEGQNSYLNAKADFSNCGPCPVAMRIEYCFPIQPFLSDSLIIGQTIISPDSLGPSIQKYLSSVGKEESAPKKFTQVNYLVAWQQNSSTEKLNTILSTIYKTHLAFVESELEKQGFEFCKLNKTDLAKVQQKYPLNIEFDLGKIAKSGPPIHALSREK